MSHAVLPLNVVSYRVTEEYDLVANPIYNISMQCTPQGMSTTSTTVATTTRGEAGVTYEEVTNLCGNKLSTSITNTPAAQLGTDHGV